MDLGTGRLTVDGRPVFPLAEYAGPGGDLARFAGGEAVADRVRVESVPADTVQEEPAASA